MLIRVGVAFHAFCLRISSNPTRRLLRSRGGGGGGGGGSLEFGKKKKKTVKRI